MDIINKAEENLGKALKDIQSICIGLFTPRYYPYDEHLLVIEDNDGRLKCVEIGKLFGLSTLHMCAEHGKYVKFPDGKTMSQMMESPMTFDEWWKLSYPFFKHEPRKTA